MVEAQHLRSTRKLVDSDQEQEILEEALEELKPPVSPPASKLHFLLFTPFRYPPLSHGSRFGARNEPSLWYGSERVETACSEVAYYRLLFLEGTAATLAPLRIEMTSFQVAVRSTRAVDLTRPPFARHKARISHKSSYKDSQRLGREMREAGIQVVRYTSARDPGQGANIALFEPAFAGKAPRDLMTWYCFATRDRVEFAQKNYFKKVVYRIARRELEVRGKLPAPAV
jgi:hypothetical protein